MIIREEIGGISKWQYKRLCMLAAMGTLELPAQDARELFDSEWETSPVELERECDVFEALYMISDSPVHLIINRDPRPNMSYVKAVGLNGREAEDRLGQFFTDADFDVSSPTGSLIEFIRIGLPIDIATYEQVVLTSNRDGNPLGAVFGSAYYADILRCQRGLATSTPEVIDIAMRRFGLK